MGRTIQSPQAKILGPLTSYSLDWTGLSFQQLFHKCQIKNLVSLLPIKVSNVFSEMSFLLAHSLLLSRLI